MHLAFLVTSGSKVRLQKCLEAEPTSLRISGYKGGEFFSARSNTANVVGQWLAVRQTHKDTISVIVAQCANEPWGIGKFMLRR